MTSILTHERLLQALSYDSETGQFVWLIKASKNTVVGEIAGCGSGGRMRIRIDSNSYKAHRLAWFYVHGNWPQGQIDHINGDSLDNRFSNLRDVSQAVNLQNLRKPHKDNKTGYLGVSPHQGGFVAQIASQKNRVFLGVFDTPELASQAYVAAKRSLHEGCTL